jgi:hypothetical protein
MKALAHNIKNIFVKLLRANKCCRNKAKKSNKDDKEEPSSKPTPIYRNKHGFPEVSEPPWK